jgi:hypothetical protein
MPDRNLLSVKQINGLEFSGAVLQYGSGIFAFNTTLTGASGNLLATITGASGVLQNQINAVLTGVSGLNFTVATGRDDLLCPYGVTFGTVPKVVVSLKCPNSGNGHLINAHVISGYNTGAYIYFSNTIPYSGFSLDLIIKP